jgi:hypothetical protein
VILARILHHIELQPPPLWFSGRHRSPESVLRWDEADVGAARAGALLEGDLKAFGALVDFVESVEARRDSVALREIFTPASSLVASAP